MQQLHLSVDGASSVHELVFSSANECTFRLPAGSRALDAQCSTVRCIITDEAEHRLADVTTKLGDTEDDAWVRLPGSRPTTSCTLEDGGFTLCVDVRDDPFLPAILLAVRVLRHSGVCSSEDGLAEDLAVGDGVGRALPDDESITDGDDESSWLPRPELLAPFGGWLRETALAVAPVRAWHGALTSATQRAALEADAISLAQRYRSRPGTFWLPAAGAEPRCGLERFALEVLCFHLRDGGPAETPPTAPARLSAAATSAADAASVCGAEWWVQVRDLGEAGGAKGEAEGATEGASSHRSIAFHWDGDEAAMRRGVHVPPLLATVTYLGGAGAPTIVLPLAADARGVALQQATGDAADAAASAYLSRPVPGKHLAFDGRLLHGCPHEYAAASPSAPVEGGVAVAARRRVSLLVNVWRCHRPRAAHRLPEEVAASLSGVHEGVCALGAATPVMPEEWQTVDDGGAAMLLRIGSGGTHAPLELHGMPTAAAAADQASDFLCARDVRVRVGHRLSS